MKSEHDEVFKRYVDEAKATQFRGWDFEYLTKTRRMVEGPTKWNYYNVVLPRLGGVRTLLDMGTGGGEVLSRFAPLPPVTYAIEQYEPNVVVARRRLEPLGVKVLQVDSKYSNNEVLPFEDQAFDLVINRHESYYPPELMRILKPQGLFITEQVGQGLWNLKKLLTGQDRTDSGWNLEFLNNGLESAGFQILEAQQDIQSVRFYDIGAVAYWLKAIPWIIEDFTIDRYAGRLQEVHLQILKEGFYDTSYDLFLIMARK